MIAHTIYPNLISQPTHHTACSSCCQSELNAGSVSESHEMLMLPKMQKKVQFFLLLPIETLFSKFRRTFETCCSLLSPFPGRSYSKTLQQAPLSLFPRRHCQEHFHTAFTSRMLCAGSIHSERRVDSCRGDSGGPLVCERPGGGWVVYGVTSWGQACRTQQSPGVYTKVSAFSSWIRKVIGRDEKKK